MTRSTFLLLDDLDDCCNLHMSPSNYFADDSRYLPVKSRRHLSFVLRCLSLWVYRSIYSFINLYVHSPPPTHPPKIHPSVHPSSIRPSIHLFVYLYSHSHRTLLVNSCNIHATLPVKSRHSMVKSRRHPPAFPRKLLHLRCLQWFQLSGQGWIIPRLQATLEKWAERYTWSHQKDNIKMHPRMYLLSIAAYSLYL